MIKYLCAGILLYFIVFQQTACSKRNFPQNYDLSFLEGKWIRVGSSKVEYDSMVLEIEGGTARILEMPYGAGDDFQVGDLKWQNITAIGNEYFDFLMNDLSGLGTEEEAWIRVLEDASSTGGQSRIFVIHRVYEEDAGSDQWWVKLE
ncbi:MAG: hypothetical protein MK212_16170 [Saprospiraceae bacterium]|nr:hypothetical protein [Saprospiraceae bacterium]